ncbi:hypothetical protein HK101_004008 [Irineochytrium annulatum]|nr:hypothetical protein HK101_004008 [Irineochytrium annulatum]
MTGVRATGATTSRPSTLRMVTTFEEQDMDDADGESATASAPQSMAKLARSRSNLLHHLDTAGSSDDEYASNIHSRGSANSDNAPTAPVPFSGPQLSLQLQNLAAGQQHDPPSAPPSSAIADAGVPANVNTFVLKPIPQGRKLECKIIRRKEGLEKLYPQYELYIEEEDDSKVFLLAARKRKKTKLSNYVITSTRVTSSRSKDSIVGKVRYTFRL